MAFDPSKRAQANAGLCVAGPPDNQSLSRHPVDRLIRELIRQGRSATAAEIDEIIEWVAMTPFDPCTITVPAHLRGVEYGGMRLGTQAPSSAIHLAARVLIDEQWIEGTSQREYLDDIRRAILQPAARLALALRRLLGGSRQCHHRLPVSGVRQIRISEGARWLR